MTSFVAHLFDTEKFMVSQLPLARLPLAQQERLLYIDMRLRLLGEVRRQDLIARFGIKSAAATRDLANYRDEKPENWVYVSRTKSYLRAETFVPLYNTITAEDAWNWLSPGPGESGLLDHEVRYPVDRGVMAGFVRMEILEVICRAITKGDPIEIAYASPWDKPQKMTIVPHGLADILGHWCLRAFNRLTETFETFELRWIADGHLTKGRAFPHEFSKEDIQWAMRITLELVPHPDNVAYPKSLAESYELIDGLWRVEVRRALAELLTEKLGVDTTKGHKLQGRGYLWWLRNPAVMTL
jgi:hypothetical protein